MIDGLLHNQVFTGALLLMISGVAMALLRKVPGQAWQGIRRRLILTVEVRNDDRLYDWLKVWLDGQRFAQNCRALSASTIGGETNQKADDSTRSSRPRILFTPAPGVHIFFYRGRFILLDRKVEDGKTPPSSFGAHAEFLPQRETIALKTLGWKPEAIRGLIEEAVEFAQPPEDPRITITVSVYGYWRQSQRIQPRSLESVILPQGVAESLLADVEQFLGREAYYASIGVPYRRGWLLHGVPGSGKSSLIVALAGHLGLNIYVLNIASKGMSDERLTDLLCDVPAHSVLLLEDIDATFDGREKTEQGNQTGVTFSGLLNALDGVASKDGRLLFMTTNHLSRLDPALIRPGRVDMSIAFQNATVEQLRRLYLRFHPNAEIEAQRFSYWADGANITMAQAQERLLSGSRESYESIAAD